MFDFEERRKIYLVQAPAGTARPPIFASVATVPGGFMLNSPMGEFEIESADGDDAVTQSGRWYTLKDSAGAEWRLRELPPGDGEWDQLGLSPDQAYEMCVVR